MNTKAFHFHRPPDRSFLRNHNVAVRRAPPLFLDSGRLSALSLVPSKRFCGVRLTTKMSVLSCKIFPSLWPLLPQDLF